MNTSNTILLTGTAGFIGSYFLGYLNQKGFKNIIIVDDFSREDKWPNFEHKEYLLKVERAELFDWLKRTEIKIDFVIHLGARTDTTEFDYHIHEELNVEYSKKLWSYCCNNGNSTHFNIPLIYASSAATYGAGELGYKDDHELAYHLHPLNPYGISKNEFDKWALQQVQTPPFWAGLKFFNVYGPNEYHKARMASMVFHGFHQINKTGKVKLFKSHRPDFKDGEQLRDFIYVADIAKVIFWMMQEKTDESKNKTTALHSGLYNLGTGKARSFNDLLTAVFKSRNLPATIEYVDMPLDIRDKYQYFTEADMHKLYQAGYHENFSSVEEGVQDYVTNYLSNNKFF
ncbi:MAG: ADP-glyceromanno-heptose 6-epimerase [Bacteroidetes bacterium]|nr:ADP-glyceromanno-heptose 6-epimerase [Bacteroidota bacterium]